METWVDSRNTAPVRGLWTDPAQRKVPSLTSSRRRGCGRRTASEAHLRQSHHPFTPLALHETMVSVDATNNPNLEPLSQPFRQAPTAGGQFHYLTPLFIESFMDLHGLTLQQANGQKVSDGRFRDRNPLTTVPHGPSPKSHCVFRLIFESPKDSP
jgi:hypothetical protein